MVSKQKGQNYLKKRSNLIYHNSGKNTSNLKSFSSPILHWVMEEVTKYTKLKPSNKPFKLRHHRYHGEYQSGKLHTIEMAKGAIPKSAKAHAMGRCPPSFIPSCTQSKGGSSFHTVPTYKTNIECSVSCSDSSHVAKGLFHGLSLFCHNLLQHISSSTFLQLFKADV